MTKRTKPRRVKARVVWMDCAYDSGIERGGVCYTKKAGKDVFTRPCIVLPRTAAAYDAMVEQGAAAIRSVIDVGNDGADNSIDPPLSEHAMIAVLRAIGITRPKD